MFDLWEERAVACGVPSHIIQQQKQYHERLATLLAALPPVDVDHSSVKPELAAPAEPAGERVAPAEALEPSFANLRRQRFSEVRKGFSAESAEEAAALDPSPSEVKPETSDELMAAGPIAAAAPMVERAKPEATKAEATVEEEMPEQVAATEAPEEATMEEEIVDQAEATDAPDEATVDKEMPEQAAATDTPEQMEEAYVHTATEAKKPPICPTRHAGFLKRGKPGAPQDPVLVSFPNSEKKQRLPGQRAQTARRSQPDTAGALSEAPEEAAKAPARPGKQPQTARRAQPETAGPTSEAPESGIVVEEAPKAAAKAPTRARGLKQDSPDVQQEQTPRKQLPRAAHEGNPMTSEKKQRRKGGARASTAAQATPELKPAEAAADLVQKREAAMLRLSECTGQTAVSFKVDGKTVHSHPGSDERYQGYAGATTMDEALSLGATSADLAHDFGKGLLTIVSGPFREKFDMDSPSRFDKIVCKWAAYSKLI